MYLYDVLDVEGEFQAPAQYYFSHIAYLNGQPRWPWTASNASPTTRPRGAGPAVHRPTLHATGQFDRLKEYVPPLLDESSGLDEESVAEVPTFGRRVVQRWRLRDRLAVPGIGLKARRTWPRSEFAYQMGYTRYRLGEWRALDCLPLATYGEDELAQNAAYHMADCYLELGDRARAKQAPNRVASRLRLGHPEDAFFHYAKLAFELSFNPFDDAIVAFESYLTQFPACPA